MNHDLELAYKLDALPKITFDDIVYRAAGASVDPLAASSYGGRWGIPPNVDVAFPVLYTSLERDGALAEVASYLAELVPMPKKPIKVHKIAVTTRKTLRLARADLSILGVEMERYGDRNYRRTQTIGATINFLGLDGLIAPSARWKCDNLMIFAENHSINERLEAVGSEEIDWQSWARDSGLLAKE